MAKTLFLSVFLILAVALFGWAAVKFYYFIRRESDLERRSNLEVRNQAEDALFELDAATRRFEKKRNRK